MNYLKKNIAGIGVCFAIAIPSWFLGKAFPLIGGAVIAILAGMLITLVWNQKGIAESGIKWTSKMILQAAVVLLGFGMNLGVIFPLFFSLMSLQPCSSRYSDRQLVLIPQAAMHLDFLPVPQ